MLWTDHVEHDRRPPARMICSRREFERNSAEVQMKLRIGLPIVDIGGKPATLRRITPGFLSIAIQCADGRSRLRRGV